MDTRHKTVKVIVSAEMEFLYRPALLGKWLYIILVLHLIFTGLLIFEKPNVKLLTIGELVLAQK